MPTNETQELIQYLDQLIQATVQGKIEWVRANPTTFIWAVEPNQPARVLIQQVDRRVIRRDSRGFPSTHQVKSYVFQALDNSGMQRISLAGEQERETDIKLEELYNAISLNITRKGLEFLKSILPPK